MYLKQKDGTLNIPADALSLAAVSGYTFDQPNQQIVLHTAMAGASPPPPPPRTTDHKNKKGQDVGLREKTTPGVEVGCGRAGHVRGTFLAEVNPMSWRHLAASYLSTASSTMEKGTRVLP
ncbi:hypothetical protein GR268_44905, partial [Rhizobium leguminosarum]|nr:hypothetical protein [Rhizobium leguminosarum]